MVAIQRIARQALLTFRCRDASAFPKNYEKLKGMMESITAADISLHVPETSSAVAKETKVFGAPVTHMSIYECSYFTLGVFILNKHGVTIPLHDHPGMFGIGKVMYGSLRIRSYDRVSSADVPENITFSEFKDSYGKTPVMTKFNADRILTVDSGVCELTPSMANYHSVQANGGQAAFLDILAPPYSASEGRDCTYYRELTVTTKNKTDKIIDDSTRWLVQVPQPRDFYCDSVVYKGPPIILED